jgi:hypothetical protein
MSSDNQSGGSFIPAPYGQACLACARAKCKCFYRSEGSACERYVNDFVSYRHQAPIQQDKDHDMDLSKAISYLLCFMKFMDIYAIRNSSHVSLQGQPPWAEMP